MVVLRHFRNHISVQAPALFCRKRALVRDLNCFNSEFGKESRNRLLRFFRRVDRKTFPLHQSSSPQALANACRAFFCSRLSFVGTCTTSVT